MREKIPSPVIAVVSEIVAKRETHATLDSLFMYAGAPGEPPEDSKHAKALEWLRRTNITISTSPLKVLGTIIENYMEMETSTDPFGKEFGEDFEDSARIKAVLLRSHLTYHRGGKITGAKSLPSLSLEEHIKERNTESLNDEFNRALKYVEDSPREAISAACNILESLFKVYIEEEGLDMPKKKDLKPTWAVIREHLNFNPSLVEDRDLKEILSGLASVIGGIGALRTHASSAHGQGGRRYKVEPRHARLAVNSSHTLALFIIESWKKKKST